MCGADLLLGHDHDDDDDDNGTDDDESADGKRTFLEAICDDGRLLGRRLLVWCNGGIGLCIVNMVMMMMLL